MTDLNDVSTMKGSGCPTTSSGGDRSPAAPPIPFQGWRPGPKIRTAANVHPLIREFFVLADKAEATHIEIANLTGYSNQTLSNWRRGQRNPSLPMLYDCLNALGYELVIVKREKR